MGQKAEPGYLHRKPSQTDVWSKLVKTEEKGLCNIFGSLLSPFRKFLSI